MKAIVVRPPTPGVSFEDVPEPSMVPGTVKVRILENGVCGTDREVSAGRLLTARPPPGKDWMILGHEALGQVEKVGEGTSGLEEGDLVMPINRRGCGQCMNCQMGRPDHCETGGFRENGITELDGFMSETLIEQPRYLVVVPKNLRDIAILAQPLSDLVKSVDEMLHVQGRLHFQCEDYTLNCRRALVTGTGPIGMLVSMLLRTYGMKVYAANRREPKEVEKRIFSEVGVQYYNSSSGYGELYKEAGGMDVIFDTTGKADVIHSLLPLLRNNSFLAFFGFSSEGMMNLTSLDVQRLIFKGVAMVGLANGQKPHFERALWHLASWKTVWPEAVKMLITREVRVQEFDEVKRVLERKEEGEIKVKLIWS